MSDGMGDIDVKIIFPNASKQNLHDNHSGSWQQDPEVPINITTFNEKIELMKTQILQAGSLEALRSTLGEWGFSLGDQVTSIHAPILQVTPDYMKAIDAEAGSFSLNNYLASGYTLFPVHSRDSSVKAFYIDSQTGQQITTNHFEVLFSVAVKDKAQEA